MPELPEVESYRRLAEGRALGRLIVAVETPDPWYLKRGTDAGQLAASLVGRTFAAARRRGKLLVLDTDDGVGLGLRFGMTGRLVVDGTAGVDQLRYTTGRQDPAWDRFVVRFGTRRRGRSTGALTIQDPRRLGGVELSPDLSGLGPDALSVSPAALRSALGSSDAPLKACLLDQSRLAGVGNLLADEILWRSGLDPARPASGLKPAELRRLAAAIPATLEDLMGRGGSHTGDLMASREPGGRCPRDGVPLVRRTVGGRTTWSCPRHQR